MKQPRTIVNAELGALVREARKAAGITQVELARMTGMTQQGIQSIEAGEVERPKKLHEIAAAIGKEIGHFLINSGGDVSKMDSLAHDAEHLELGMTSSQPLTVPVVGELQAGAWMEADQWDVAKYQPVFVEPERFETLNHAAWKVNGSSMDLVGIADGAFAVTVPYKAVRIAPQKGDAVVVERRRNGTFERTCKEVGRQTPAGLELIPRSSDPRHKAIIIPPQGPDEDGAEVEIIGLVVGSYKRFGG